MTFGKTALALVFALAASAALGAHGMRAADAATAAGTNISNAASATYSDGSGGNFTASSNTVTVVVQNVAIESVTNVTTGQNVAPYQTVTDRFLLTNAGNNAGKFALTALPSPTAQSGTPTVRLSIVLTPQGGSPATVAFTGNDTTDLASVNTALNGMNVAAANTVAVDVKYGTGSFVLMNNQTEATTLSATLTYAAGSGYAAQTTAAASTLQNDTVLIDAILDLENDEVVPSTSSQNVKFDVRAANHGLFSAQPVALSSIGLPGTGVIAMIDRIPVFNSNPLALKTVPTVTTSAANGYAGTGTTIYYTTATAPFTSGSTWTAVTGATTVAQLAFAAYLAVVVTGPNSFPGKDSGFSATGNVPNAAVLLHFEIAQPTGVGSSAPGAVKNMANSVAGSNATDASGVLAPLLVGPNSTGSYDNSAVNAANINGMIQNTLALGDSGASGSGYSNRTAGNAVLGAVSLGPLNQPTATGAFTYDGATFQFYDSGAADTNHDYTSVALYTGVTGGPAGGPQPSYTTPASPALIAVPNTVLNGGNVPDTFAITVTPSQNAAGWTVTYANNAGCTGSTSSYTTPTVAVAGSFTFYACITPPGNTALPVLVPYGFQHIATSTSDPTAVNSTYNLFAIGGFLPVFKDAVVGGTPSQGTQACATVPAPGCTITYTLTYVNGNPRSGVNDLFGGAAIATTGGTLVSAGISGLQILDDGVNGVNQNAATGLKNNWGNLAITSGLTAAPADSSGKCSFSYLYDGSTLTTGNGSLTPPTVSTPATAFRCNYGSNTLSANLIQTITFAVTIK